MLLLTGRHFFRFQMKLEHFLAFEVLQNELDELGSCFAARTCLPGNVANTGKLAKLRQFEQIDDLLIGVDGSFVDQKRFPGKLV